MTVNFNSFYLLTMVNNQNHKNGHHVKEKNDVPIFVQKSADTGSHIANLYKKGQYETVAGSDITYMNKKEDGKLSVKSGMAYSHQSLDPFRDASGKVKVEQFGKLGEIIDTNDDGYVSDLENLAYTYFQDATSEGDAGCDGTVTSEEAEKGEKAALDDPEFAESRLEKIQEEMSKYL